MDDKPLMDKFIRKCLGDFRCKSDDQLKDISLSAEDHKKFPSRLDHNLDIFIPSHSFSSSSILKSKNFSKKRKRHHLESESSNINQDDDEIDENEDNDDNESYPICGVSSLRNIYLVNKKQSLLRIACDHFAGHKWNSFLQISHALILNTRLPGYLLMKNFLFFLYIKSPHTETDFIQAKYFVNELLFMMEERYETLLELIMYLIENKHLLLSEKKFINDLHLKVEKKRLFGTRKFPSKSLDILMLTFRIYEIYLDYLEWKSTIHNPSLIVTSSFSIRINKMKTDLQEILSQAEHNELNLDIVVLLLLELYDYENELSEALTMFEEYSTKFKDNLNAHVYLYEFLSKYDDLDYDPEVKIKSLKNIARLCPDSKYTLKLVSNTSQLTDLNILEQLELICNFLDYNFNRNSLKAWKILYQILNRIENKDEELIKEIQRYFGVKLPYWQRIHFNFDFLIKILPELRSYYSSKSDYNSNISSSEESSTYSKYCDNKQEQAINRKQYYLYIYKGRFLDQMNRFGCLHDKPTLLQYKDLILNLMI